MYFTYILHNLEKDKFYIGQTGDLENRIIEHNSSTKKTFTSKYRPWNLYWSIELANRASAMGLEKYLKGKNKEFFRRLPIDEELNIYLVNRFRDTD